MESKKDLVDEGNFDIQKLLNNPKFLWGLVAFFSFFLIVFVVDSYKAITYENPLEDIQINVTEFSSENNPSNLVVVTGPIQEINFSDVGRLK